MKKYILTIASFVLAMSCSKEMLEGNELTLGEGTPVTVEVGAPGEGDPEAAETRITETINGKTYSFVWDAGDAFRLLFWKPETAAGQSTLRDAGEFTTLSGGEVATFTGSIPSAEEGEYKTYAIYPASAFTAETQISTTSSAANKFSISNINLSAEQDGTGFKYCCFASVRGVLNHSGEEWSFTTAPRFSMSNGIMHLKLNPSLKVTRIAVTCEYPEYTGTTSQYLAGNVSYATNSTGDNSKGSEKTVTVYNGGTVLPEDVYIAVRHTVSNATYGVCHLKFSFYSEDGRMATKTLKLAKYNSDGTFKSYVNVGSGKVYSIGTINTLSFAKTKKISWVGDTGKKVVTLEGPDGAAYKGFPYANSSSAASVTQILDGQGGAVLVKSSTYTEEKTYKVWTDKTKSEYNLLTMGGNTAQSSAMYYTPSNIYQIRMKYGYVVIPAMAGYKLTHVFATFGNGADSNVFSICSDMSGKTPTTIDGISKKPVSKLTDADFELRETKPNTPYWMYIDGDRLITSFEFTYSEDKSTPSREAPAGTVDLGLSVFWATCNLGASSPEERGDYYAWGETEPHYSSISGSSFTLKEGYDGWFYSDYKYCKITPGEAGQPADTTWTKYSGSDGKTQLDPEDDAAHVLLGGQWRMPTHNEWEELRNNTRVEEKKDGDTVIGYYIYSTVSGYEDNCIYIPMGGFGYSDKLSLNPLPGNAGLWSSTYFDRGKAQPGRSYAYREMPCNYYQVSTGLRGWTLGQLPYGRNIRPVIAVNADPEGRGKDFDWGN